MSACGPHSAQATGRGLAALTEEEAGAAEGLSVRATERLGGEVVCALVVLPDFDPALLGRGYTGQVVGDGAVVKVGCGRRGAGGYAVLPLLLSPHVLREGGEHGLVARLSLPAQRQPERSLALRVLFMKRKRTPAGAEDEVAQHSIRPGGGQVRHADPASEAERARLTPGGWRRGGQCPPECPAR